MKKYITKLGGLIGTPEQDFVKVIYKGHAYKASEYDVRHLQVVISEHFLSKQEESSIADVDEFLNSIGISAIFNQAGQKINFRGNGRPVEGFCSGFFDTAAKLALQLSRNERIYQTRRKEEKGIR